MLPVILKIKIMTTAMAGWTAASAPAPVPAQAIAAAFAGHVSAPVQVDLFDENDFQRASIAIWRDGDVDDHTRDVIMRLFRCRRTHKESMIHRWTLAMLADVADHYPGKTIEYVSAFRIGSGESRTSPHRDARAIDFRIRGYQLRTIRDHLWRSYAEVGVGWYPEHQYIHIDARPTMQDMAWTFVRGRERYHPQWSYDVRRAADEEQITHARRP